MAVSYTHLDVYKRQASTGAASFSPQPTSNKLVTLSANKARNNVDIMIPFNLLINIKKP